MRFIKYLIPMLFIIVQFTCITSQEPKILWEKVYKTNTLKGIWLLKLFSIEDNLALIYHGFVVDTGKNNAGLLIVDKMGQKINQFEYSKPYNLYFDNIFKKANHYYILSEEVAVYAFYMFLMQINEYGEIIKEYRDSAYNYLYDWGQGVFHNDSLYFSTYDLITNKSYFDVYDNKMKFKRKIFIESTNIPFKYHKGSPPWYIFTKDGYMLSLLLGSYTDDINNIDYTGIIKNDINGMVLSAKKFYLDEWRRTMLIEVFEREEEGFMGTGFVWDSLGNQHYFLARFSEKCDVLKYKVFNDDKYLESSQFSYIDTKNHKLFALYGGYRPKGSGNENTLFWLLLYDENCDSVVKYIWKRGNKCKIGGIAEGENGNLIIYGKNGDNSLYVAGIELEITGIEEINYNFNTLIYPSPANDYIIIENNEIRLPDKFNYSVIDITGKVIEEFCLDLDRKYKLSTKDYAPGIYFIHIKHGNNSRIMKVVISR
jgi:hypothetical protein